MSTNPVSPFSPRCDVTASSSSPIQSTSQVTTKSQQGDSKREGHHAYCSVSISPPESPYYLTTALSQCEKLCKSNIDASFSLSFTAEDLISQQSSLKLLIERTPIIAIPGTVSIKGISRYIDLTRYTEEYTSNLATTYNKFKTSLKGKYFVIPIMDYFYHLQISKLHSSQINLLFSQLDLVNKDAAKAYSLILDLQGADTIKIGGITPNRIEGSKLIKSQKRNKVKFIDNCPCYDMQPSLQSSNEYSSEYCTPFILEPSLTQQSAFNVSDLKKEMLPRYLSSSSSIHSQLEGTTPINFITTPHPKVEAKHNIRSGHSSARVREPEVSISSMHNSNLEPLSADDYSEFVSVVLDKVTKKHRKTLENLKFSLNKMYSKDLENSKKKITKKYSEHLIRFQVNTEKKFKSLETQIANLKKQNANQQELILLYSEAIKNSEEKNAVSEDQIETQLKHMNGNSSNRSFEVPTSSNSEASINIPICISSREDTPQIDKLDKPLRTKHRELEEIEARIKSLTEKREELALENGKLTDAGNLLQMRNVRLKTNVHCLLSQQKGLNKKIEYQAQFIREQRQCERDLNERYQIREIAYEKLKIKHEQLKQKVKQASKVSQLENILANEKLIAVVCLLYDHLVDIMVAMNDFVANHVSMPSYIDEHGLVTYKRDKHNYASLFLENNKISEQIFNMNKIDVSGYSIQYQSKKSSIDNNHSSTSSISSPFVALGNNLPTYDVENSFQATCSTGVTLNKMNLSSISQSGIDQFCKTSKFGSECFSNNYHEEITSQSTLTPNVSNSPLSTVFSPSTYATTSLQSIIAQKAAEMAKKVRPTETITWKPHADVTSNIIKNYNVDERENAETNYINDYKQNITSHMLRENLQFYDHFKKMNRATDADKPNQSGNENKSNEEEMHPRFRKFKSIDRVQTDFFKYVNDLGLVMENFKCLLNYIRLSEISKREKLMELQIKHDNQLKARATEFETMKSAMMIKTQHLERNCEYFKHENERILRYQHEEYEKSKATCEYLKAKYEPGTVSHSVSILSDNDYDSDGISLNFKATIRKEIINPFHPNFCQIPSDSGCEFGSKLNSTDMNSCSKAEHRETISSDSLDPFFLVNVGDKTAANTIIK